MGFSIIRNESNDRNCLQEPLEKFNEIKVKYY